MISKELIAAICLTSLLVFLNFSLFDDRSEKTMVVLKESPDPISNQAKESSNTGEKHISQEKPDKDIGDIKSDDGQQKTQAPVTSARESSSSSVATPIKVGFLICINCTQMACHCSDSGTH